MQTKKSFFPFIVFVATFFVPYLGAQSLLDNQYFQKSLEYKALADQSYEEGDYDSASDYALRSQEYASLSDEFVTKAVAKKEADTAIGSARKSLSEANAKNVKARYPLLHNRANQDLKTAGQLYNSEEYEPARDYAILAQESLDEISRSEADAAIAEAKAALERADASGVRNTNAAAFTDAETNLNDAQIAYNEGHYPGAENLARMALNVLASVDGTALPNKYIVRLIPSKRDCLWNIAAYPFIYNNPFRWPVLYEANKSTFRNPANPNLIYPGQSLTIPSIAGEQRSGTYDPAKKYPAMIKK